MEGARRLISVVLLFCAPLLYSVSAGTDPLDVSAINALYRALNSPVELNGWKSEGGDPCGGESWLGVLCSGLYIVSIKINGLGVSGQLSSNLSTLKNLKELDISKNSISGPIPDNLPPNAAKLNFSCNMFNANIPFSFSYLTSLTYLNLSRNSLFGHIGNIFTDLHNLQYLDLSFNHFSGDLPCSFASLSNLRGLYLQENHLTGSVYFLAYLPLISLNIENNHFSGVLPKQFESIPELKISGNIFHAGYVISRQDDAGYSAPSSPSHTPSHIFALRRRCDVVNDHTSLHCPGESSSNNRLPGWGIEACVISGLAFSGVILAIFVMHDRRSRKHRMKKLTRPCDLGIALPVIEDSRIQGDHVTGNSTYASASRTRSSRIPRKKFTFRRLRAQPEIRLFSLSDLEHATGNFNVYNFIGNSLFGPSYKGDLPCGQVVEVQRLEMWALSREEDEIFMDFVLNVSRLKHPNVRRPIGYCCEQGQHFLIFECMKNLTLEYILHSSIESRKLLPWISRITVAIGVARALEYLHWGCSPPMPHENLTASSILIDEKMIPHLGNCGLGMIRPIINSELQETGYNPPECRDAMADKTKSDVFSFGVLLLELLCGRKPLDKSRGRADEYLVKWASSRLHDIGMLEDMMDPLIKSDVSAHILSRFADIVLPCIQAHSEFRPVISEVGDQLSRLLSKIHRSPRDGRDVEPEDVEMFSMM